MIVRYLKALIIARTLEKQGLVSIEWPPANFIVSQKIVGIDRDRVELVLSDYAKLYQAIRMATQGATLSLQVVSAVAAAVIVLNAK